MHRSSRTLTPLAGIALVVFFLIGVALSGSEPAATASPAHVIAWYSSHASQTKASGYVSSVSVVFGLVFFAYVRNYLSEAGGSRVLATAAFGGAIVFACGGLLGLGVGLSLAADPGQLSASAAQALNLSQGYIAGLAINFGAATLLLAAGTAAFIGRRFPVWTSMSSARSRRERAGSSSKTLFRRNSWRAYGPSRRASPCWHRP